MMNIIHQDGINKDQTSYYYKLRKYQPIWYSGKQVPYFLILRQDAFSNSLPCLVFINMLAILIIILSFVKYCHTENGQEINIFKNLNILILIFIDIFYILTVILNPGIVSEKHMESSQQEQFLKYCQRCNRQINNNMKHCIQCQVCVENIDHHCAFFGKCIAGVQRFAFYGFLTFMFLGFITLLGSISLVMSS